MLMMLQTVSAALKILCSTLLVELEKPLDDLIPPSEPATEDLACRIIIREYHAFLAATVKFLYTVQGRSPESPISVSNFRVAFDTDFMFSHRTADALALGKR